MLKDFFQKYETSCRARNLTDLTIVRYKKSVRFYDEWLEKNNLQVDIDSAESFLASRSKRVSKTTVRSDYVAISTFLNYCVKHKLIAQNPFLEIKKPRLGKHAIRVFSGSEINAIFSSCDKETFIGLRNFTLFSIMFSTGCRVSEICNLKITEIDWENNWIIIHGKGDKDRFVPMSNALRKAFKKYLIERKKYIFEHHLPITPYLMITRAGNILSKDEINNTFRKIKDKIHSKGARFSSHTFRHTFATLYLKNGGDVFSLQKILGHERLETTKIYVNFNDSDMRTQMMRFNPLDNQNWQYI